MLLEVAQRLQASVRPEDTVARRGGDEFTVLLEDIPDASAVIGVAERMPAYLRAFSRRRARVFVIASIGIALSAPGHDRSARLLRAADMSMYQAKISGKGQYRLFEQSLSADALERLLLERDLRHAVECNELQVVYQPIVDLATGGICELEALVRWQYPQRGVVPPEHFIPLAEEIRLILPIGRWVLEEACRQARTWQLHDPRDRRLIINVNLSIRQFQHPGLVQDIAQILHKTQLDPAALNLEITESIMLQDSEQSAARLRQLKALGLRLSIDDFGMGFSSLAYLKRLPIDTLKIDRSFIDGLGHDPEDTAIVQAIIQVAHTLKLRVTAEGIETAVQVGRLQTLGCDQGQGYYFSKPLPSAAISELLAAAPPWKIDQQGPAATGAIGSRSRFDRLLEEKADACLGQAPTVA